MASRTNFAACATVVLSVLVVRPGGSAAGPGQPDVGAATTQAQPRAHALVIGSNAGGQGQETLRFAERDADAVGALLVELGGYQPGRVHLLKSPSPEQLDAAFATLRGALEADAAAGHDTVLFFYYSGHARASGLSLGEREVALTELRRRLRELPARLTVVVLDACQSGAFSRVKGASPAADFSFNSVSRLNTSGVAVMASSTATELSQESERLRSSYFTHHLITGLRGAADGDRDGRVSLAEVYRYAYHRTLVSTAATAVGSQHVTLETELSGKGDVALTFPERASSHLRLPGGFVGTALVERASARAVIAEVHKAGSGPLDIAVPPGRYQVILRSNGQARRCDVIAASGRQSLVDPSRCALLAPEVAAAKGPDASVSVAEASPMSWAIELSFGFGSVSDDAYTDRLQDFGYESDDQIIRIRPHGVLGLEAGKGGRFRMLAEASWLENTNYQRDTDGATSEKIAWSAFGLAAYLRVAHSVAPTLVLFGQAGAGLSYVRSSFASDAGDGDPEAHVLEEVSREVHMGPLIGAAAGLRWSPYQWAAAHIRADYTSARALENLLEDTHDSGGPSVMLGVRFTP